MEPIRNDQNISALVVALVEGETLQETRSFFCHGFLAVKYDRGGPKA